MQKPDLDNSEHIREFVEAFYDKLLNDERLAPIFLDVAAVDIREHFPRIQAYWEKLLLGGSDYNRHTMNIHRQLNNKQTLTDADFDRWLDYFVTTADAHFSGERTERAKRVASQIAENMRKALERDSGKPL
ncbi:MAG TPA: globin [Spongiibacteraceae bacterium]|nr:globin [Spongiibacteraceae bacterium]MBN48454.1 globin [Spongiibacteraceae bacterium]HCS26515.1 globin [Spongiibacteraceae bacterium]|tara:strand:- start:66 stop:458 length:393 start_codon:yes stop_codon:yes gene_type:complete